MITADNLFLKIEGKQNHEVQKYLLQNNIDITDEYGRSALINSAFYDNYELVEWLIEHGADKNLSDDMGFTALHFAAQEANYDSAKILLREGADPNIQDIHGNTPSWVAVMNWKGGDNFDLLKKLIEHNANLEIENKVGKTTKSLIPEPIMQKLTS